MPRWFPTFKTTLPSRACLSLICTLTLTLGCGRILTSRTSKQPATPSTIQDQTIAEPTTALPPTSFNYVELFDRNHWLVAESNRLLKTEDAGRKWTQTYTVTAATAATDE